ncbi:MAG TPA: hypothetical protein PK257_02110 [Candidatus Woesebacteria bacterium]|nr:hypothetical protein [Candidatus Woesebacteria bacterium]
MNNCEFEKAIVFRSKDGQLLWNAIGSEINIEKMVNDIETVGGTIIDVTSSKTAKSLIELDRNKCESPYERFDF